MAARVVLTRPAERQVALQKALSDVGFEVLSLPALSIESADNVEPPAPESFDWMVFVSRAAWQQYWLALREQKADRVWPSSCRLVAVGMTTAQYIKKSLHLEAGQFVSVLSPPPEGKQDSEALWQAWEPKLNREARVLIVRGQDGRDWLSTALREQGCHTERFEAYRREPVAWAEESVATLRAWGQTARLGVWLITSVEGLSAIQAQWARFQWDLWRPDGALVIHPRLASPVKAWLGHGPVVITQPNDHAIIEALTAGFDNGTFQ